MTTPATAPLSAERPHLFVTRTAVLAYQEVMGGGFEAIRRKLTTSLLSAGVPDPENEGCYLLRDQAPAFDNYTQEVVESPVIFRVYTIKDGPLLVVPKVEVAGPAP